MAHILDFVHLEMKQMSFLNMSHYYIHQNLNSLTTTIKPYLTRFILQKKNVPEKVMDHMPSMKINTFDLCVFGDEIISNTGWKDSSKANMKKILGRPCQRDCSLPTLLLSVATLQF